MYETLLPEIAKRVADLQKFTDDSFTNHHQIRGRLMEASEIQSWLNACAAKDSAEATKAKAKGMKGSKAKPVAKKKVDAPKTSSNVTPLPKKAAKPKAVVAKTAPANG